MPYHIAVNINKFILLKPLKTFSFSVWCHPKETLHEYIDNADEKKLEAIYTLLKDSITSDYQYSHDELSTIYNRRNKYKNGEEQTLTAEQFVSYVLQN